MVSGWTNRAWASGASTTTKGQGWRRRRDNLTLGTTCVLRPVGSEPWRQRGDDLMESQRSGGTNDVVLVTPRKRQLNTSVGNKALLAVRAECSGVCGSPVWGCWKQLSAQWGSLNAGGVFVWMYLSVNSDNQLENRQTGFRLGPKMAVRSLESCAFGSYFLYFSHVRTQCLAKD